MWQRPYNELLKQWLIGLSGLAAMTCKQGQDSVGPMERGAPQNKLCIEFEYMLITNNCFINLMLD